MKKYSISKLYAANLLVFLSFTLAITLMQSKLKVWFMFLVSLSISLFESYFYYKKNGKSFTPVEGAKLIEIILMAIASTVVLFGSLLFVACLFKGLV